MIKVGLDIGNSKISLIVCDKKNNNSIKTLSFVVNPIKNVKKNFLDDLTTIKDQVWKTIVQAQKESQTEIKSIILALPAIESLSIFNEAEINISGEKINDLHLKKAINESKILNPIENYETINNLVINYDLDKKNSNKNPIGSYGDILKINFYKFLIKKNIINTFTNLFNELNIYVEEYVPIPMSSSLATLNEDDKLLGAICIDLGASSSSIAIYENEKIIFMGAINIGAHNITNDIARGISTTIESAERLKTLHGSVISSPSDENDIIEVSQLSKDPSKYKQINRSNVNQIIKPRVEENLELIWQKLREHNLHKKQIKNLVLTGGGSLLEGINEYAQIIFDSNVRIGRPHPIEGLSSKYLNPQFSQTIGTILFNKKDHDIDFLKNKEKNNKNTVFSRFSSWLDQYI